MHVARGLRSILPKVESLKGDDLVNLQGIIKLAPLFGVGFGKLLTAQDKLATREDNIPACCNFLAAHGDTLESVIELHGNRYNTPWRIGENTYWHAPEATSLSPCACISGIQQRKATQGNTKPTG